MVIMGTASIFSFHTYHTESHRITVVSRSASNCSNCHFWRKNITIAGRPPSPAGTGRWGLVFRVFWVDPDSSGQSGAHTALKKTTIYNTGTSGTCKFLQPKLHQLSIWLTVFYNTFDWQNFSYHQRLGYPTAKKLDHVTSYHNPGRRTVPNGLLRHFAVFTWKHYVTWYQQKQHQWSWIHVNSWFNHQLLWSFIISSCVSQINQVAIFSSA